MNNGYSICLNIWALDKDIKNELGLLLIISSLCAEKGFCFASNKYLAKQFDITEQSISNKIKKLENKNYIKIEYEKRGCEVISRKIRLKNFYTVDIKKIIPSIKENFKDNNISINNISINNKYIVEQIINYLNFKTNKQFKKNTANTIKHINARLNEGYILEDFKRVIDIKCDEWLNDKKMNQYLRPDTLFGTKFESYLNQQRKNITTKDIATKIDFSDVL